MANKGKNQKVRQYDQEYDYIAADGMGWIAKMGNPSTWQTPRGDSFESFAEWGQARQQLIAFADGVAEKRIRRQREQQRREARQEKARQQRRRAWTVTAIAAFACYLTVAYWLAAVIG